MVVRFASKSSPVHCIGQIIQQNVQIMKPMNTDRNRMQVNFLRREKPTVESFVFSSVEDSSFIKAADNVFPSVEDSSFIKAADNVFSCVEDSSFIKAADIVFKLPDPILHGGTARLGSTSSLQRISTCLLTCINIEGF